MAQKRQLLLLATNKEYIREWLLVPVRRYAKQKGKKTKRVMNWEEIEWQGTKLGRQEKERRSQRENGGILAFEVRFFFGEMLLRCDWFMLKVMSFVMLGLIWLLYKIYDNSGISFCLINLKFTWGEAPIHARSERTIDFNEGLRWNLYIAYQ